MKLNSTFLVTVTPARENAGEYHVSSEVARVPDDVGFLTMYACSDFDQALGYFDEVASLLTSCAWSEPDWLDQFNDCLGIGDLAQVCLYQLFSANLVLARISQTVVTVGSGATK